MLCLYFIYGLFGGLGLRQLSWPLAHEDDVICPKSLVSATICSLLPR